jgi:hypothetical protein
MQAIKVHTVTSDGAAVTAPVRRVPIQHPRTGEAVPGVWVEVTVRQLEHWREIQKRHQTPQRNPVSKMVEWTVDDDAARFDLLVENVRAWSGFVGQDDQPLRVCPAAVAALDHSIKMQLALAILENEVVSREDTFREPA